MATVNQKKVVDLIIKQVQNGSKVSVTKAMRDSGVYSKTTSTRPEKITKSKGYIKLLEEAGLTDEVLARKHNQLINSSRLEKDTFDASFEIIKEGRKKLERYTHISDDKIRALVEGSPEDPTGNKVSYIKKFERHKEVFYRVPDNVVQAKALELGLKVKDHLAPEKIDIVDHEVSKEEKQLLTKLFPMKK